MRVLYVIDGLTRSGAEQSLVALVPELRARDVVLEVAYLYERGGLRDELVALGVPLVYIGGSDGHEGRLGHIQSLRRIIHARRPDLVHTTLFEADIAGRIAARLAGVPVASSLVNVHYGPEQRADPHLVPWKVRGAQAVDALTARACGRFHAISTHVADVMASRLMIRRQGIDIVPRGRDPKHLGERTPERRARARGALGVGIETPLVLAAARQEHQKGLDVLVQAMPGILATFPRAQLVIAGREGGSTRRLRAAIDRLGIDRSIRLLGERSDVGDLMVAADVFVLPSRWEGLGGVVLEAMALKAPIVASDLPPVREVVGDQDAAALVPAGDVLALTDAVTELLKDADRAADRASRAYDRFMSAYTIDRVADGMAAFFARAAGAAG